MTLPEGAKLGTTTDPKALIKGEPTQVSANATRLSDEAKRVSDLAGDFDAVSIAGWTGGFGEPAYVSARSAEQDKWKALADVLTKAAKSLSTYAGSLTTAQSKPWMTSNGSVESGRSALVRYFSRRSSS